MRRAAAIFAVLAAVGAVHAADAPRVTAAAAFIDSVGVNTHLRHNRSVYDTQFAQLEQKLLAAHIRHIRDSAQDLNGEFWDSDRAARFAELGRAGIRTTFVFRPLVPKAFVQGWVKRVAPALEAYELPNEINQSRDLPWPEAMRLWMPMFRQYAKEGGANYPVIAPSIADLGNEPHKLLGDRGADVDFGNIHKYYRAFNPGTEGYGKPGSPPCDKFRYGALAYELCQARRVSGDKPIIATEAGYATAGKPGFFVTPEVQARYLVRMLLLHYDAGVQRTFIYQLADHGSDAGGSMGLLDGQGNDKPAWRALRVLMDELADTAAPKALRDVDPQVSGATEGLRSLVFQKADGSYRWVLWIEKPGAVSQRVAARMPAGVRARRAVTLADDGAARDVAVRGAEFPLEVTDRITIVELDRAGA